MFPVGLFLDMRLKADKCKRISLSHTHIHTDAHTHTHARVHAHKGQHLWGLEGYTGYNKKQIKLKRKG